MARALVTLAVALALLTARDAAAGPPTDQLRGSIDLVLKTLTDPELKKEANTARRRATIRSIANEIFDFAEISQRSLGRHWQARTPAEREEFARIFGDLLENAYISKIESYSGEKIQYLGDATDGDQATVKTRIVTKQGTEIPVDYRMLLKDDRWRAYDVNIEGVSLVANYRTQFNAIIQRTGYPDLVAKLRAKQAERPGGREAGRREETVPVAAPLPPRQSP
ncbi:MAG TPA: ABC transporter substrate-binding protein [Methylomirabilota bacterium]|jgi:phospholipid transport system substrate-binding protein|nr:ABC transporter substrate-binding protein [Methylomirabilota bacterium]